MYHLDLLLKCTQWPPGNCMTKANVDIRDSTVRFCEGTSATSNNYTSQDECALIGIML
jgi:hypothetical protein